jgi:protein ImuB
MFAAVHITAPSPLLVQLAGAFSPQVELASPDTVVFDIDGLRRMFGGPHQIASEIAHRADALGLIGNIGIAQSIDTAILAARNCKGVRVIPPGEEARVLGDLRISALPMTEEMLLLLERWGIRTVGEFCALPESGVLERLGADGRRLLRIARGDLQRPLRVMQDPVDYGEHMALDDPVQLLEPLLFLISRLLHELCTRLKSNARATSELEIVFDLEGGGQDERRMQIPFATQEPVLWLKLIQLDLESDAPPRPVVGISLKVTPVDPRMVQHHLYAPISPQPEKLELTLGKIRAMVGVMNAGFPEVLDTHRPNAYRMRLHGVEAAPQFSSPRQTRSPQHAGSPRKGRQSRTSAQAATSQFVHPSQAAPLPSESFLQSREEDALCERAPARSETAPEQMAYASTTPVRSEPSSSLPLCFRYFRPPKEAAVELVKGVPYRIRASGISETVKSAAGPWRLSGDWWSSDSWSRTEWDILLSNHILYRLCFTRQRWYLEGIYD